MKRISIEHVTRYRYAGEASYSVQSLRLTPATFDGHSVVDWQMTVEPAAQTIAGRDGFGNVVHLLTVTVPHSEIVIRAAGAVDVEDRTGVVRGLSSGVPPHVFLRRTALTMPDAQIAAIADSTRGLEPIPRLHAMMEAIRDRVAYETGATSTETTAAAALAHGVGVCQDHAHIFLAAARAAGFPARYVTGYLLVDDGAPAEAHHAWAEAWVEGLGWIGFDVANRVCPTDRYVRMAAALDARYAAPIRGSRRGGDAEQLDVEVKVRQQATQQSQSQQ